MGVTLFISLQVTTTDDPVIRKLVRTDSDANVYATDSILATLMTSGRSAYSWDIVVQKIADKIFLDKRDNTEFGEKRKLSQVFCCSETFKVISRSL